MRVKECMSENVVWVTGNNTIYDAAKLMNENHIGSIPVCDNNQNLVGIITDRDIVLRTIAYGKDVRQTKVTDIMTTDVIRTSRDTEVSWVANMMAKNQIRRVPVVEDEKLVGIITIGDLARNAEVPDQEVSDCMCQICNETNQNSE